MGSTVDAVPAVEVPTVTLNSGAKMGVIGFGTGTADRMQPDRFVEIFLEAIRSGYCHFDTAMLYRTERPLGEAIEKAVETGLVASRDDIFVTSKLWCTDADADMVRPALKKSLENLKLDYLDQYLIHWPVKLKRKETLLPIEKDDFLPFDMKSTWAAMEECQRLGLAKSIGVSNFSCKKLSELLAIASIPPAVNQVEMNPAWQQKKLREFCKEKGIHVTAYSPLGANGASWGSTAVIDSPVLKEIAQAKGKSVAQIALRWLYEQGVIVVVKSFNKDRMKQNLQIFDWELTEEERNKINNIEQKRGYPGMDFVSPNGPYKTIKELWDGEI